MSHSKTIYINSAVSDLWEILLLFTILQNSRWQLFFPCSNQAKRTGTIHEFHETCQSVIFIVLVNSHQRWKQTRNRVCFHLWCELTLALWSHSIVGVFFHKIKCNGMTSFMEFILYEEADLAFSSCSVSHSWVICYFCHHHFPTFCSAVFAIVPWSQHV